MPRFLLSERTVYFSTQDHIFHIICVSPLGLGLRDGHVLLGDIFSCIRDYVSPLWHCCVCSDWTLVTEHFAEHFGWRLLRRACIRPCPWPPESRKPAWVVSCCTRHRTSTCAVMERTQESSCGFANSLHQKFRVLVDHHLKTDHVHSWYWHAASCHRNLL